MPMYISQCEKNDAVRVEDFSAGKKNTAKKIWSSVSTDIYNSGKQCYWVLYSGLLSIIQLLVNLIQLN